MRSNESTVVIVALGLSLLIGTIFAPARWGGTDTTNTKKLRVRMLVSDTSDTVDVLPPLNGQIDTERKRRPTPCAPGSRHEVEINSIVRLRKAGSVAIYIGDYPHGRSLKLTEPKRWFPIVAPPNLTPDELRAMVARADKFDLGGRERAEVRIGLCWPQSEVPVARSLSSLRWNPGRERGEAVFDFRSTTDAAIGWTGAAPAAAGRYDSSDLQEFLRGLPDSLSGKISVEFSLPGEPTGMPIMMQWLSQANEGKLLTALGRVDSLSEPDRSIMRASILLRARQYPEAADAYEAAWRAETTDVQTLLRAAHGHRVYGNSARVDSLRRSFPPGVDLP